MVGSLVGWVDGWVLGWLVACWLVAGSNVETRWGAFRCPFRNGPKWRWTKHTGWSSGSRCDLALSRFSNPLSVARCWQTFALSFHHGSLSSHSG
jgi:hypothetical protein